MQRKQVELLAPAGNMEGFYGAIHAGADAVYLGGNRFGARAYADNFTTEELIKCIRYAHLWGRKVYLTVNTLVKESEFNDIYDYLLPFYEAGLDGVIVQDIGVLVHIRECFPGMELHVSTQMTLTGEYGAKMLREMGACRIVPARELSLAEIKHIKEATDLEMETFIHGAMCYCYSGQCLFSSILGGRSGNRGRCAQPCRLPYEVEVGGKTSGECYPLSLKDMCTIEHIPDLIRAGIDSFKIEGRMKKPEYTAGVTAIYRKYIDKYYIDTHNKKQERILQIAPADSKALSSLYIRSEKQDGYYYKHNGKEMVTLDSPAYSGNDEALLAGIRQKYLEQNPKKEVSVYADFRTGNHASVTYVLDDISVTIEGDVVASASRQPINQENVIKQLSKLGESIFKVDYIDVSVSDDAFYPLRAINELRREAVTKLEDALIEKNGFPICRMDASLSEKVWERGNSMQKISAINLQDNLASAKGGKLCVSLRTKEQLEVIARALLDTNRKEEYASACISRIYLDSDIFGEGKEDILSECKELAKYYELVISLPYIIRERDYKLLEQNCFLLITNYPELFSGVQVRSVEGMGMLKAKGYQGRIYSDAGFYIWNQKTLQEWSASLAGYCMPFELKGTEQRSLLEESIPCEKVVYGRIPMMITANCVAKTTSGCRKTETEKNVRLLDRYHKSFPVELNCTHCMNIIYNSVPLSLHGELAKWKDKTDFRLDFTVESKREILDVLQYFLKLSKSQYCDSESVPPYGDYTTGHEKRGVE